MTRQLFLPFAIFTIFLIQLSSQCIGLGCFGGGCGGGCLFGLCIGAPMIQPIGCPCGASFMCIRGGCVARAMAAGTKTFKDSGQSQSQSSDEITNTTPDEHFATCCTLLDVPGSCTDMCSYSTYSSEEVSAVLLQQSTCPANVLQKIHFCAARGTNHTECCTRSLVPIQCHSFCDQSQDKDVQELSLAHLQCVHYFNDIKTCFVEHANSEYFESGFVEDTRGGDTSLGANF